MKANRVTSSTPSRRRPPLFFKISRSVMSLAFSRRSRVSSARSSAVSGSRPLLSGSPRSARAALTQLPSVVSLICRSRATSAIVLPVARTSSTACSRNSGDYLLGRPIRTPSSGEVPKIRVSTEAGQLQCPARLHPGSVHVLVRGNNAYTRPRRLWSGKPQYSS
jgi:hypothetical protein